MFHRPKSVFVETGPVSHQCAFNTVQRRSKKAVRVTFCQYKNVVATVAEVDCDVPRRIIFPEAQWSYSSIRNPG